MMLVVPGLLTTPHLSVIHSKANVDLREKSSFRGDIRDKEKNI